MNTQNPTAEGIPWLVMVYMAGDNSLSEDMVLALQDLMAEGPPKGDHIVAQFDPDGVGLTSQRYECSAPTTGKGLEAYRVKTFKPIETNTGDKQTLIDFVKWAVDKHSTRNTRYLLILSGHGSGITQDFFLSDSESADSLTIQELSGALKDIVSYIRSLPGRAGRKIDILGMDACYMAMGEIAYEIHSQVGILIGAEGAEAEFGWPYRRILAAARKYRKGKHKGKGKGEDNPPMDAKTLARTIVEQVRPALL